MEPPRKRRRTATLDRDDPAYDLVRDRHRNDSRLKGAFENIFLKYTKDFTNVGDEVDLKTGQIVVNNGHISRMRDEQDVGDDNAGAILRAFTEDIVDNMSDDDGGRTRLAIDPILDRIPEIEYSQSSDADTDEDVMQPTIERSGTRSRVVDEAQDGRATPGVTSKPDTAAFEALGKSIAMQIAQFMGQYPSSPLVESIWSAPPLPQHTPIPRVSSEARPTSRRHRPSSPPTGSLWAVPDPYTGARPIRSVAQRFITEPRSIQKRDATPNDDNDSDKDYDDAEKRNFPTYLERARRAYSANTSVKRAGSGRKSRHKFSEEDNMLLLELKEEHGFPWATICSYWPDRPPWIVQHHYHRYVKTRNADNGDPARGQPDGAEDEPGKLPVRKRRAKSKISKRPLLLASGETENGEATSSPLQSRGRPIRRANTAGPAERQRKTTPPRVYPQTDDWDLGAPSLQESAGISPGPLHMFDDTESSEGADLEEQTESRSSSPDILNTVEPEFFPSSPPSRKKSYEHIARTPIGKSDCGLVPGKPSIRKSLTGHNPRGKSIKPPTEASIRGKHFGPASGRSIPSTLVRKESQRAPNRAKSTPRTAHTPRATTKTPRPEKVIIVKQESDDKCSSVPASNIVNISDVVVSPPKSSKHRNHASGRRSSGAKSRNRKISDLRSSSKAPHTPSKSSGLKRSFQIDDDDTSADELSLL